MFCKRDLFALTILLLLSQTTNAQLGKWINKAKDKALEKVAGKKADTATVKSADTTANNAQPAAAPGYNASDNTNPASDRNAPGANAAVPAGGANAANGAGTPANNANASANGQPAPPKPIQFPHTGVNVKAIHGTMGFDIDGDIQRIAATPQGKYLFDQARQRGLKGTDVEIFRQAMDPKNQEMMQEIQREGEAKFRNDGSAASGVPGGSPGMANPAWGGISSPSLMLSVMIGSFDTWITARYFKASMTHDHSTLTDAFGANGAAIMDLDKRVTYALVNVFGISYTKADTVRTIYGTLSFVKEEYLDIPGTKIEPGIAGKFGDYNTASDRITIPVAPYIDKESGRKSNGLLFLHDVLSRHQDAPQMHYDPSYRLIVEYYFTHDLDKYLPGSPKPTQTNMLGSKGVCIGATIKDEKGNTAVWRLTQVQTNQDIDEGEFQLPADYPIMTKEQRRQAIRAKMGMKK